MDEKDLPVILMSLKHLQNDLQSLLMVTNIIYSQTPIIQG